ncbi:hypothetical protein LBMAG46_40870 [Planctomycetia bacterium]|nr:hypothetical protein LBMAG46_40870 [Planctomycetia bacterium]
MGSGATFDVALFVESAGVRSRGASEFHAGIDVVLQPSGVAAALPAAKCLCLNFKARGVPSIHTPVPKSPESLAPTKDTQQPGDLERSSREIDSRSLKWTTE